MGGAKSLQQLCWSNPPFKIFEPKYSIYFLKSGFILFSEDLALGVAAWGMAWNGDWKEDAANPLGEEGGILKITTNNKADLMIGRMQSRLGNMLAQRS